MQSEDLALLALGPRLSFLIMLSLHFSVHCPDFMGGILGNLWQQRFWETPVNCGALFKPRWEVVTALTLVQTSFALFPEAGNSSSATAYASCS